MLPFERFKIFCRFSIPPAILSGLWSPQKPWAKMMSLSFIFIPFLKGIWSNFLFNFHSFLFLQSAQNLWPCCLQLHQVFWFDWPIWLDLRIPGKFRFFCLIQYLIYTCTIIPIFVYFLHQPAALVLHNLILISIFAIVICLYCNFIHHFFNLPSEMSVKVSISHVWILVFWTHSSFSYFQFKCWPL